MRRILVVDDEEKIRAIIRKYGEFEGYDITEAKDGMEAVKLCREQDFDVIILDVMMPELDGFSTCREIRKTKNIPVSCCRHAEKSMIRFTDLNLELTIMW